MINRRLLYFLETNKLLCPFQNAFRAFRNTAPNIMRLISSAHKGFEKREPTLAVFLDLSSAFNKVHRSTVLLKLHDMGIRGRMAEFLKSFLKPRDFRIKCLSVMSDTHKLEHGLPQGGVLSPSLFLIAINDIGKQLYLTIPPVHFSLYADDLALWCTRPTLNQACFTMQKALNQTSEWCKTWGFFFSVPKSAAMVFKRGPAAQNISLKIDNEPIFLVNSHKFLGITLDTRLTFRAHVEDVRNRCLKRMNVLKCVCGRNWGADRKTLTTLYFGLIRSVLDYNCFVLSLACQTFSKRLESIQSSCLRIISGAFRTTPVVALQADTNIPSLADRRMLLLLRSYLQAACTPDHPSSACFAFPANRNPSRSRRPPLTLGRCLDNAAKTLQFLTLAPRPRPPPFPFWSHHPFSVHSLLTDTKANTTEIEIISSFREYKHDYATYSFFYTDGSAHGLKTGAAVYNDNYMLKVRLPDYSTVFSAEIYAIKAALSIIKRKHISKAVICSDSRAALQAIMRFEEIKHPDVYEIIKEMTTLPPSQHVILLWIPGHSAIPGNVQADKMANEAIELPTGTPKPIALCDTLHHLKECFKEYLQTKWESHHDKHLIRIKPILRNWPTSSRENRAREVLLARLRLGHTRLTHSHIFDNSPSPKCTTCNEILTVEHILLYCRIYTTERQNILMCLRKLRLEPTLSNLLGDDHPEIINEIIDFFEKGKLACEI